MPLREERHLENVKFGSRIGYVQCDIEVLENLPESFAKFPTIFKNINIGRDDFGPFMVEYSEKEGFFAQPRRTLVSSFFLEKRTINAPLLVCYPDLWLVCKKVFCLVQYTPMK